MAVTLAPRERKQVRVESSARRPEDGTLFVSIFWLAKPVMDAIEAGAFSWICGPFRSPVV